MDRALTLEGVTKRYAGHTAVESLSLEVPKGTIYGILGPNGAGKSTTLRMVMNILVRDGGRISLLGADPEKDRAVLRRVGFLPEERGLYKKMSVTDVIVFFAELKGADRRHAKSEAARWLERMGLAEWKGAKVETLSKGMQQKVQFIATVVHDPELLILDEPHSGLDPVNQQVLRDTILQWRASGRTVLFSTHNMEQAEQLCEHVCIIAQGRKVLDGSLKEVRRAHRGNRWRVETDGPSDEAARFFATGRFGHAERHGDAWSVELAPHADPRDLMAAVAALEIPILRFEREELSLHDIFVRHVGDAAHPHRVAEAAHA